jgi:WD40 repeat protein
MKKLLNTKKTKDARMNTKNMLFLALIGLNVNTFGMEKVKDFLFGHHEQPVEITGGWTLSTTYNNGHHISVDPIAFDITKKLFVTHEHSSADITDRETKDVKCILKHPDTVGIWEASFFPTGDRIVTVSDDQFLRIFALNNKEPIAQFNCHDNIRKVGFDKDGSLLVGTFQGQTLVYVNDNKCSEHRYLEELSIAYLAEEQADTSKIDSGDILVTTFALHFALDEDQLKIIWNSISAEMQKLLLKVVQKRNTK